MSSRGGTVRTKARGAAVCAPWLKPRQQHQESAASMHARTAAHEVTERDDLPPAQLSSLHLEHFVGCLLLRIHVDSLRIDGDDDRLAPVDVRNLLDA